MMLKIPVGFIIVIASILAISINLAYPQSSSDPTSPDTLEQKVALLNGVLFVGDHLYENRQETLRGIVEEFGKQLEEQYVKKYESVPEESEKQAPSHKQYYVYRGPRDVKAVALSFDDGPNSRFTPRLLEVLKGKGVSATFFFLGEQVDLYPDVARAVAEAGFEIGNHTYSHRSLRKIPVSEAEDEIDRTQRLIIETTGATPVLLRPPYGECNAEVVRLANERHLKLIFWTIDTDDYRQKTTKGDIVEKVMKEIRNGAIILMHDRNTKTIEATEEIIDRLRALGYKFYTVSQLLGSGQ